VEAAAEMRTADALMIFQASNCNHQIPAKIYEYMYSQKPILALTDRQGDTGQLLASVDVQSIADLENVTEIKELIRTFLPTVKHGSAFVVSRRDARRYSRKSLTSELRDVLVRATTG
jgi:hypothetical protein